MLFMAIVAGATNALVLALINVAAENAWNKEVSSRHMVMYAIIIALFMYTKKYAMTQGVANVEHIIRSVRLRITEKLRRVDLLFLERLGPTRVYGTLTQDTNLISQSAMGLMHSASSVIMLVASFSYLAAISLPALLVTLVAVGIGVSLFLVHHRDMIGDMTRSGAKEAELFEKLHTLLSGFSQVKVNHRKSEAIYHSIEKVAVETESLKISTGAQITIDYMFSQIFYYSLIGVIIFVVPQLMPGQAPNTMKIVAAILFIMGPLDSLVASLPLFGHATVAVHSLQALEAEIDAAITASGEDESTASTPIRFERSVTMRDITFSYRSDSGENLFTVGPIDLELVPGEIVYLVGGNGSGKSSLIRLLSGLYHPDKGDIAVDGNRVFRSSYPAYRELFAFVPTDFHLFDQLYGVEEVSEEEVAQLLTRMDLSRKTQFVDGRFTETRLSTGQRKRLALISAILEDKQIYILDECAADQDPQFKHFYYTKLLPSLKAQGKTVVAVTHDEFYFSTADRVLKLDYGKLVDPHVEQYRENGAANSAVS